MDNLNRIMGQYRFTNDFLLDVDNTLGKNVHISIHENIHKFLLGCSTVGILLIMMEKISVVDNSKKWLMDTLIKSLNNSQEQIATYIEIISILENSPEEYQSAMEELKSNKIYYNYFRKIDRYIKESKCAGKEAYEKIMLAALYSLNINLNKIPFKRMSSEQDFQKFMSLKNNNFRFNPNTRFKLFLKNELGILHDIDENNIVASEMTYNDSSENIAQMCKSVIEDIYFDSVNLDTIKKRIETIGTHITEFDGESDKVELFSAFPIQLNRNIDYCIRVTTLNNILCYSTEYTEAAIKFNHLLTGIEQVSLISFLPFCKNEEVVAQYNPNDIIDIINNTNNPIVFAQSKLYKKVKHKLSIYKKKRIIYIVMEGAVHNNFQFIKEEFESGEYTVINSDLYRILAMHKENMILVQLISKELNYNDFSDIFLSALINNKRNDEVDCDISMIRKIAQKVFISCSYAQQKKNFGFRG